MPNPAKPHLSLLGEAFALRESRGWSQAQDGIQLRRMIDQGRRRALLIAILAVAITAAAGVILVTLY